MIGTTLGHYRILKQLGAGGMGEVYMAEDLRLERTVAIKVLRLSDTSRLDRFITEAKAASALSHSHAAHVYEIGEEAGINFIVMEYVEGQTLSQHIQDGPLSITDIVHYGSQIADALGEAHRKGVIHRDIKPSNIMVTPRGEIKVLDFGVAKISQPKQTKDQISSTKTGVVLGTLYYMSPEQVLGKHLDYRTDIFSLGVVLYQMATGRVPFEGRNTVETMQKILKEFPDPVARFNEQIPVELETIILKCLEKDPHKRYQSADKLCADLQAITRGSQSSRITAPIVTLSSARARYVRFVAPALLVLALIAFLISVMPRKSSIRSLAVLPFANSSQNAANDYLSDGITENMINQLSQVPDLKVMARSTVFTYKGKEADPRRVGRELGVDAILTGRLLQQGENLNIQVSLVRTSDGANLWGEEYPGKVSEIFIVQNKILTEVSRKLRPNAFAAYKPRLVKDYTKNVEAYQLYLKGRYYLEKRTRDDFQRAVQSFQEAVAHDPDYALAHAGLSDAFTLMCNWGFLPAKSGYPKAKEAAERAIELDDSLAEAHTARAAIEWAYEWNWKAAEKDFLRAIQLNPNYAPAYHWYAFYLSLLGRHEEALRQIRIAQQLDPLSIIINSNLGYTLYLARKYDESIRELRRSVEFDRDFSLTYQYLGYAYEQTGDSAQSVAALEQAVELSPDNLTCDADLARAYATSGKTEEAQKKLDQLLVISTQTYVPAFDIASVYIGLKQYDRAMEYLERAFQEHADQIVYIGVEPRFDPLRKDPRFQNLLRRLGLRTN